MDERTALHFSQSNPRGAGQDEVPALLRRVADTLSDLGDVRVLDVTFQNEVTAEGNWPSMTVYYLRQE